MTLLAGVPRPSALHHAGPRHRGDDFADVRVRRPVAPDPAVDPNQPGTADDTNVRFYYDSLGRLLEEAQLPAGLEGGVTLYTERSFASMTES